MFISGTDTWTRLLSRQNCLHLRSLNNLISNVCLKAWSQCSAEEEDGGNVFSWETGQVRSLHMEELQLERTVVCRQEQLRYLAFATKRNFLETQHFCRTLSGDIAVTTGTESVQSIQESLESIGGRQVRWS